MTTSLKEKLSQSLGEVIMRRKTCEKKQWELEGKKAAGERRQGVEKQMVKGGDLVVEAKVDD